MFQPTVSVVIPAYNNAQTIEQSLKSVFNQTYPPAEIVIIDDGSSDNTYDICVSFAKTNLKIPIHIHQQQNQGVSSARNNGVHLSKYPYIAFLDANDIWLPEKLAVQLPYLQDSQVILVTSSFISFTQNGEESVIKIPSKLNDFNILYTSNYILPSTVVLCKDNFVKSGGFNETYPVAEDLELWLKIWPQGRFVGVSAPLMRYRNQPNSLSKKVLAMAYSSLRVRWRYRYKGWYGYYFFILTVLKLSLIIIPFLTFIFGTKPMPQRFSV